MFNIKNWPLFKRIYQKKRQYDNKIAALDLSNNFLAESIIDLRLRQKKLKKEKINVVFVCHRPSVWGSLKTVYEALKADPLFNVFIVAIPNKKELPHLWLNHEIYESEGAEEFWKKNNCINGYNYKTKKWFDLRELKPDYVFFQQPYNITRSPEYKSWIVSKYAKLCYVAYGAANISDDDILKSCTPEDFLRDLSFYFSQDLYDDKFIKMRMREIGDIFTKVIKTGFPRYDSLTKYIGTDSNVWNYKRGPEHFRVLWTPRWCTNEGNCHFFDYKDKWMEYCDLHPEIDFVFRPHPQAFMEWEATGELPMEQGISYREAYAKRKNMNIDCSAEYLSTFYSSDCLVTDVSSLIGEYFLTGKPIIYCHKKDCFNEWGRKLSEGFYWVRNWRELTERLSDLQKGNDPQKGKREKLINELYELPKGGAGIRIATCLKIDAFK